MCLFFIINLPIICKKNQKIGNNHHHLHVELFHGGKATCLVPLTFIHESWCKPPCVAIRLAKYWSAFLLFSYFMWLKCIHFLYLRGSSHSQALIIMIKHVFSSSNDIFRGFMKHIQSRFFKLILVISLIFFSSTASLVRNLYIILF